MHNARVGFRYASLAALIVAASFIPRRVKAYEDYTSPRNADVTASGARSIRIEAAAGNLKVEGRAGITQVRVRGTARSNRRSMLDDIKLIAERRGDEVFIKADMPENRGSWDSYRDNDNLALDLVIEVPNTIPLDVGDGSGEAEFVNTGALEFSDGSGEIRIRDAGGDVRVTDGSGNVTIEGVKGSVRVHDGSGNIRARDVTGNFTVDDDGSGDINVSGVGGTMRVENDGSGSIDVDRVAGDFVVDNDGSGGIRFQTVKGRVDIPNRKRRS
jgi:DUF4097 and DUF4098 domain-containing protein YvlB